MAAASQDNNEPSAVPQWKRELILRRRAIARNLGSSSVQFTCPPVVAAVRHPETHTIFVQSSTAVASETTAAADRADFHLASSSAVEANMRLVEHRRLANGGGDCHNNGIVDPVKYRAIMGEEKSKKSQQQRKMDNSAGVHHKGVGFVLGDNENGGQEAVLSDSSEELQYGPGIVKKLKSKYMSMTLREGKNKGVRPALSQMRRATSLENMIDSEQEAGKPPLIKPAPKFAKRPEAVANGNNKAHQQRYRSSSRGNEGVKRARSVEALLRYDVSAETKTLLKSLSKDEIVIVEKPVVVVPVKSDEKPPVSTATRKKRPAMNGLPPADVVKTTLRLFEPHGVARGNLAKLNVGVAGKPSPGNKPLLSPKPSPEKIRRAKPIAMDAERKARLLSPVTVEVHELAGQAKPAPSRVLPLDLEPVSATTPPSPWFPSPTSPVAKAMLSPGSPRQPAPVSPLQRTLSPVAKQPSPVVKPPSPVAKLPSPVAKLPSPVAKLPSPVAKLPSPVVKQPPPVSEARAPSPVKRTPSPTKRSPAPAPAKVVSNGNSPTAEESSEEDETVTDGCVRKAVTAKALENIRQGGSTVEFCFSKAVETAKPHLPGNKTQAPTSVVAKATSNPPKSPAPAAPAATRAGQSGPSVPKAGQSGPSAPKAGQSAPKLRVPMSPLPDVKSPDFSKQVCVIRPIVSVKQAAEPARLTDREVKKNLINSGKTEQPKKVVASLKASEIVSGNVSDSLKEVKSLRDSVNSNGTGLWDSGKKPWNQQQNTMVFNFKDRKEVPDYIENDGIIMRIKREKIRPGDSGFILLDPSLEESSTDCELDEPLAGPPSPCNVVFEGDNVLINGKSSLRKHPRPQPKLRITFNDDAMQLFEYPSESSLLSDPAAATSSGLPVPPPPSCPSPALPSGVGGGHLSSYTSKASMTTEDFQLGVSRTTPQPRPRDSVAADNAIAAETPAEDNVAWSQGANDHLMF